MRLDGKRAVVTGAASGIGRATARAMARAGAFIFVADIDTRGGEQTCSSLVSEGAAAKFVAVDITDDASIEALNRAVDAAGGPADVLVNAAGWDRIEPFVETSSEWMERIVAINLLGTAKVARAFLPGMIQAGRGRIVNVASDAGRVGSSGEAIYSAAKGGVIALTKSIARETARYGINVNCVCPGPTDTPLFRSLPEKLQASLERAIPFRRLGRPEEIADAILFFASDRSDFITGQTLSVSGGLTMAG